MALPPTASGHHAVSHGPGMSPTRHSDWTLAGLSRAGRSTSVRLLPWTVIFSRSGRKLRRWWNHVPLSPGARPGGSEAGPVGRRPPRGDLEPLGPRDCVQGASSYPGRSQNSWSPDGRFGRGKTINAFVKRLWAGCGIEQKCKHVVAKLWEFPSGHRQGHVRGGGAHLEQIAGALEYLLRVHKRSGKG